MRITILGSGTSQGVPIIGCSCNVCLSTDSKDKRLRTSIMIEVDEKTFVIDTGPDFRQQMLRENVKLIDAIIYTHEHKDHTGGFDDIRAFNFILKKEMEVYASHRVLDALKRDYAYVFSELKYPGIPEVKFNFIENEMTIINGVNFLPIEVMHHKLPVFGFRINDFTYITDANYISEKEKEKIKGSKIIVLNALRRETHISHFTFQQAIELINELKPQKAYFTHISHQLGLHNEVEKELPAFISLAYDGLKIEI